MTCQPQQFFHAVEIPNCDDPVFRAWCKACELTPGTVVNARDVRIAKLEQLMHGYDPTYDPESDTDDDYLYPFSR
jgi:hypothetical protein